MSGNGGACGTGTPTATPTGGGTVAGAIAYTGGTYTQGFDGTVVKNGVSSSDTALANTGSSSSAVPAGFTFVETGTSGGTTGLTAYKVGASSTGADTFSLFPTNTPSNRAFGSLTDNGNNITQAAYGFLFQNNTGRALSSFTVSYTGEVWGSYGSTRDELDLQYKVGATSISESGFSEVNSNAGLSTPTPGPGDFVTPAGVAKNTTLDGTNQQAISQTFTVNIPVGGTIAVRFVDYVAALGTDELGIDNFSFSATLAAPVALITEYSTGIASQPTADYVELYNNSSTSSLDLNGYSVVAGTTTPGTTVYTFTASTIVPPRGHVLLTGAQYNSSVATPTDRVNGVPATNGTLTGDIPQGGGVALLAPTTLAVVDQVGSAGFFEGTALSAYTPLYNANTPVY